MHCQISWVKKLDEILNQCIKQLRRTGEHIVQRVVATISVYRPKAI